MLNQRIAIAPCSAEYRVCVMVKLLLASSSNLNDALQGQRNMRNDLMHRIVDTVQNQFVTRMCPVEQVRQCTCQSNANELLRSFSTKTPNVVVLRMRFVAVVYEATRDAFAVSASPPDRAATSSSSALM